MLRVLLTTTILFGIPLAAHALEIDTCTTQERKFNTVIDAARGQMAAIKAKYAGWYADPNTLPQEIYDAYRDAVRLFVFNKWKESPSGKALIPLWNLPPDDPKIEENFIKAIYLVEIKPELEKQIVQKAFQQDYEDHIKQEITDAETANEKTISDNKAKLDDACSPTVFAQFFRVTIGNLMATIGANIEASKNESGDISKAIHFVSGISVDSIQQNGLQGGENSELHKLNDNIDSVLAANGMGKATVVGQIATALNPTEWKIDVPTSSDVGKAAEKAVQDVGKTAEKTVQDAGKTAEKTGQDIGKGLEHLGGQVGGLFH